MAAPAIVQASNRRLKCVGAFPGGAPTVTAPAVPGGGFLCVPSMNDSLEVEVLYLA